MSNLEILKSTAQVWKDGAVAFRRRLAIRIKHTTGNTTGKLFFELEKDDSTLKSVEFELNTDDGTRFVIEKGKLGTLTTCLGFAPGGGSELNEVIIERGTPPHDQNAPAWCILFYWNVSATASESIDSADVNGDKIEANATATIRVFSGVGIVDPDLSLGASDLLVRLGIETFMLDTGWMPLPSIGGFNLGNDDPDDDGENDGFWSPWELPNFLSWFEEIVETGEDALKKLPKYRWDRELPIKLNLPLGLRFKEQRFSISGTLGDWRVNAVFKGLIALWNGKDVAEWNSFAAGLEYDSGKYTFFAHFAVETYPKSLPAEPYEFSLPFDVLGIKADCWRLTLGLFSTGGDGNSTPFTFCFDGVLEVGELQITSGLSPNAPLYKTELRLHLRDLSIMTAEKSGLKLFAGETSAPFTYYQLEVPQMTFAQKLKDPPPPGAPNESGLSILDGDFAVGERFLIAWEQKGNQLIKALAADILGNTPAGKIPEDAKTYKAALEVAWFADGPQGRSTQVRFDWRTDDDRSEQEAAIDTTDAFLLPSGSTVNFKGSKVGKGLYTFDLPGISMKVTKPEAHSLVFQRGSNGRDTVSYLFLWPTAPPLLSNDVALAKLDIGMSLRRDGGQREVQDDDPFLSLALGVHSATGDFAMRVAGWQSEGGPQFFRYTNSAVPAIIIESGTSVDPDACPPRPTPRPAPVDLAYDAFRPLSFGLGDPWRLSIKQAAEQAISKLFGKSVEFKIAGFDLDEKDASVVYIKTEITISLTNITTISGEVTFRFDLSDLSLSMEDEAELGLAVEIQNEAPTWAKKLPLNDETIEYKYTKKPIELMPGLELDGIFKFKKDETAGDKADLFTLDMTNGRLVLKAPANVDLILRNGDLGDELTFLITEFEVGPAGIDLAASMVATKLKLPGLKTPFLLEDATLRIVGGKLQDVGVRGSGRMPALLNEAPFTFELRLTQGPHSVVRIADFEVSLGDGKAPIFSRGTRFRFDLTKVTIGMDDAGGTAQQAWHFLITGSMQFVPEGGEFLENVLEDFQSITMEFQDAPLSDEFFEHVELIATLTEPKVFPLFSLFEMEVRSIGFHPAFEPFGDTPAVIIGGQAKFADTGDVLSAKVDFHRMYIGFPKSGEILPQFYFKGLRVEIASSGFKIAGELRHYDTDLLKGFAGSGTILIPGMPELTASFAFTKLRAEETDSWKRGWFIAVEAAKISYQIGPLPMYLRQVGLGFGYRYTSVIIKRFEEEDRLGPLVALMKREINNHQTLADLDTWAPDAERDGERGRWSIGLEAVFSMASANSSPFQYHPAEEKKLQSVVAQLLIFLRSDLTFLAATKVWFPVSADDFFENRSSMRQRPLGTGFMLYSAPKNRLLIHAAKGKNPYLGPPGQPVPEQVKKVLDQSHFEATFLSEPGLVHAELGWPDRLFFKLDMGLLTLECRGGVLFRVERGVLVQGLYFSATGKTELGGGLSLGIVGVRVSAKITVTLAMRLMIGIQLAKPLSSNIYAVVGFSVTIQFSIHAWFRLNLRFVKISIDIYFRLDLQIVLVLELGWAGKLDLGFRGRATLIVSAFGRGLSVKVSVAVRPDGVNRARNAMKPYMRSYLDEGGIPPIPGLTQEQSLSSLQRREKVAIERTMSARGMNRDETREILRSLNLELPEAADDYSALATGEAIATTKKERDESPSEPFDFRLALARGQSDAEGKKRIWFGWIMPAPETPAFYPVPEALDKPSKYGELGVPNDGTKIFFPKKSGKEFTWEVATNPSLIELTCHADATSNLENEDGSFSEEMLTLGNQLAACYLPADYANYGNEKNPFPGNYDGKMDLRAPAKKTVARLHDDRLDVPGSEAENPRRQLEAGKHDYDDALLAAAEEQELEDLGDAFSKEFAGDDHVSFRKYQLSDQAEGTQSYLARAFADDLKRLADTTRLEAGDQPVTPSWKPGRPTILDMGMVVCVVAEECPAWLMTPAGEIDRPSLKFVNTKGLYKRDPKENWQKEPEKLQPVIDFEKIDFELSPPSLRGKPRAYLDDDSLHFGWDIDWGPRGQPLDKNGNPAEFELEDFIAGYEVVVTQVIADRKEPIDTIIVGPADIRVGNGFDNPAGPNVTRLKGAYQYNRQLSEIGIDPSRFFSIDLKLTAQVTPISQDGTYGAPFNIDVTHKPSRRPLPPDNVRLELGLTGEVHKKAFSGLLSWRELVLPSSALVAETTRWDLVLRPLSALPPGAYPAVATDDDDAPLSGENVTEPRDGDLIVWLQNTKLSSEEAKRLELDQEDVDTDRDPARALHAIELPINKAAGNIAGIYDHLGAALNTDDDRYKQVIAMLEGQPANSEYGAGWHLFLRASADPLPDADAGLPALAVSAKVRARISLRKSEDTGPGVRPLQHLEWVHDQTDTALPQIAGDDITSVQGPIHLAAPTQLRSQLEFLPLPGTDRGVTLWWNASDDDAGVLDVASYHLYETRHDTLVNVDVPSSDKEAPEGFGPVWQKLREVQPVSPADAGRVVSDFATPETWYTMPPVKAKTIRSLVERDVPPAKMPNAWPSWYSWADSELKWMPTLSEFASDLESVLDRSEQAPQQVPDYPKSDGPPSSDDDRFRLFLALAAQHSLGRYYARRRLHPWLQIVVGRLTAQGASYDGTSAGRFEVEVSQPKAPPTGDKTVKPDPVVWMQSDNIEADPTGWGALGQLGLAAGISLRDPWTGTYLLQSAVRKELETAISETNERLEWLTFGGHIFEARYLPKQIADPDETPEPGKEPKLAARPHKLHNYENLIPDFTHVGLDLPMQANWAERASSGKTGLNDARMLSMVQLSLRPVATALKVRSVSEDYTTQLPADVHYAVFRIDKTSDKTVSHVKLSEDVTLFRILRRDMDDIHPREWLLDGLNFGTTGEGDARKLRIEAKENPEDTLLTAWLGKKGEFVILRHRNRTNSPVSEVFQTLFGEAYGTGGKTSDGALFEAGFELELLETSLYDKPRALSAVDPKIQRYSPWGKFAPDINWMHYFFLPDPKNLKDFTTIDDNGNDAAHTQFATFLQHVTEMFAGWGGETDADAEAIRKSVYEPEEAVKLVTAYLSWGERFFTAGPALARDEQASWVREIPCHQTTTAWPEREAPMRSAPDARGRFQVTHRIAEDWASERGYAATRVRRWRDIFEPEADLPMPKLNGTIGRTDIAFPRRRAIRPANLLGARVILSEAEQPFHEITLSEPVDLALSKSSNALARKIEFEAIMRQFRLNFRHTDWETVLGVDVDYTSTHSSPGKFIEIAPDISVEAAAGDYLQTAPRARLGAIRIQTPSEPYYYDQEMRHYVAATHVQSEVTRIQLPPPPAMAPWADKDMKPGKYHKEVSWSDVGDKNKQMLLDDYVKHLTGDTGELIKPFLRPDARKLTIRAPRLYETLARNSVYGKPILNEKGEETGAIIEGYHRHEAEPNGYGQLPDPDARLEIVDGTGDTRRTVATMAVDHEGEKLAIVGKENPLVKLEIHDDPKEVLEKGLRGTVTYWTDRSAMTADLAEAYADFPAEIGEEGKPYESSEFPNVAPLRIFLPLRLRLIKKDGSVSGNWRLLQDAPLSAPRWMFRPHLEPGSTTTNGTEDDLAYALRALTDRQRRWALAAAAIVLEAAISAPDVAKTVAARRLLKEIEEARAAMVSTPMSEVDVEDRKKLLGEASADDAVTVYALREDTVLKDPKVENLMDDDRLLLVFGAAAEAAALIALFGQKFAIGDTFTGPIEEFDAISDQTAALGSETYRSAGLEKPEVYAHHANIPPALWVEAKE